MQTINGQIARELGVRAEQIDRTVALLDEGATVPFIARYRKEVTGGLDDGQLRELAERLIYLRDMEDRRGTILKSIEEQGKLTPELTRAIQAAETKSALEDLYLPYKKKRRTKAQIAREAGLEPLATALFEDPTQDPMTAAAGYVDADKGVPDAVAALDGARQILMENFSEDAVLTGRLREYLTARGIMVSTVIPGKEQEGAKFRDYFDYREPLRNIPSHRALALFRGRNEEILNLQLLVEGEEEAKVHPCAALVASHFGIEDRGRPADGWLLETTRWAWKIKLFSRLELELKGELRDKASDQAIDVFAENLRDLLLAAPAGARVTMGLDPGLRTGVKVAVVDATGKVLDTGAIYPHAPKNQWDQSLAILAELCRRHQVNLISIGNGTASRETDRLAGELCKKYPELKLTKLVVSEAGASVYSASALAADELPDLDVSLRGAVSIARRLQDPLAELVKIDPKSIGVGQYQHDVSQVKLARKLDTVVEDCVNSVGVDVNIASAPLLARVAGLTTSLAQNIVDYRNRNGAFRERSELMQVPRMGDKAFEQAGGFLRIVNGSNPLDNSAVHPEAYPVVRRILDGTKRDIRGLIGDAKFLRGLQAADYTDDHFGVPTITDILKELEKPGRDPRPEFTTAAFMDGVESIKDLKIGMILEGVVSNVTHFGAFVDIGVHQDGLVHISMLSDKYVKDPRDVVKTGDVVKVKVLEVDVPRNRIALTMRLQDKPDAGAQNAAASRGAGTGGGNKRRPPREAPAAGNSALADALRKGLNL